MHGKGLHQKGWERTSEKQDQHVGLSLLFDLDREDLAQIYSKEPCSLPAVCSSRPVPEPTCKRCHLPLLWSLPSAAATDSLPFGLSAPAFTQALYVKAQKQTKLLFALLLWLLSGSLKKSPAAAGRVSRGESLPGGRKCSCLVGGRGQGDSSWLGAGQIPGSPFSPAALYLGRLGVSSPACGTWVQRASITSLPHHALLCQAPAILLHWDVLPLALALGACGTASSPSSSSLVLPCIVKGVLLSGNHFGDQARGLCGNH